MASPLDARRWAPSPEIALRTAMVLFAAGAVVPTLCCLSLALEVLRVSPYAIWLTVLLTTGFAYGVARLSRPQLGAWRAPAAFALSIVGGVLNGAAAGGICGSFSRNEVVAGVWGGMFGIAYGIAFGFGNALLVEIARRSSRSRSIMSAGRTASRLAAAVGGMLSLALALSASFHEQVFFDVEAKGFSGDASIEAALFLSAALTLLVLFFAAASAREQHRRRRWLERVTQGDEPRYRVLSFEEAPSATELALFDGDDAAPEHLQGAGPDIIVRVDVAEEVEAGAYRQAEHLTPLARVRR